MFHGELTDTSNFSVICSDEEYDGVWCDGNPDSPDGVFKDWDEVYQVLSRFFPDIEEITAV